MATPFLGEVKMVAFNFAPKGWAICNGQLLSINQNQAPFSILGITYGGNGQTNFALPNLQVRVPLHMGSGFVEGQAGGSEDVTLDSSHSESSLSGFDATPSIAIGRPPAIGAPRPGRYTTVRCRGA